MILASLYGSIASQKGIEEFPTTQTLYDNDVVGTGMYQHNYTGTWTLGTNNPGDYEDTIHYSNVTNDIVTFQFTGFKVEWISEKFTSHGIIEVSIDGVVQQTVDQYAPGATPTFQQILYTSSTLSQGVHTIQLRVTGTKNAASTNTYLVHDAFKVYSSEVVPATGDKYVNQVTGNDLNTGTFDFPFATIQRGVDTIAPGKEVWVYNGTYRETITPPISGTLGNEIIIKAAPGQTPVISGLDLVTTPWVNHTGNIYKTTMTMPTRSTPGFGSAGQADQANEAMTNTNLLDYQVFQNGTMQIEARWPKGVQQYTDLLTLSATGSSTAPASTDTRRHTSDMVTFSTTQITDNALNVTNGFPIASGGLVGATLNTHGWFIAETRTISTHGGTGGTTITFPGIWNDEKVRKYYWLSGKLGFLTQQREFHYESNTLYFWQAGGGVPTNVEYKARNWGFNLKNRSYIKIEGLTFKGCEPVQGNTSTNYCTVDGIRATHTNHTARLSRTYWQGYGTSQLTGLKLAGTGNILQNSELDWGGSQGVWIGAGGTVQNNKIEHYGYDGMWGCGVSFWGEQNISNIKVLNNSIGHMGRGCIDNGYAFSEDDVSRYTTNNEIAYNDFYGFCKLNQDGGAFYSWGWHNLSGTRIHHNWFHDHAAVPSPTPLYGGAGADGIMAAIYFDMGSGANVGQNPCIVDHNVFWNIGNGAGWVDLDWADVYTLPSFVQNTPDYPDYQDRVSKQATHYYNNTFWGDRKSYVTYQSPVKDIMRNNISRREINPNWGPGGVNINYSIMAINQLFTANTIYGANNRGGGNGSQATDPLFNGGTLTTPEIYFGLQASSQGVNNGTALPPYTDGSSGTPDIGAYERGVTPWKAGYTPPA